MDEEAVLKRRTAGWLRLVSLSDRVDVGWDRLSGAESLEFVRLYRQASSDLAYLSSQTSNAEVVEYLNSIVARAYGQLYVRPRRPFAAALQEGLAEGARAFRRQFWAFLLAVAFLLGGAFFAFGMMKQGDVWREFFVPAGTEELFATWREGKFESRNGGESIAMTAMYAQNNPRAGIVTHGVAVVTLGVGTAMICWSNGTLLGALAADMDSVGKLGFLLSSIVSHGVSEIGGFMVSGAGGFVLGRAVIAPGRRRRAQALRESGKEAVTLLLVGLVMIVLAAPVEGFFSFNPRVPQPAKVAFATLSLALYVAYFAGYGREPARPSASRAER